MKQEAAIAQDNPISANEPAQPVRDLPRLEGSASRELPRSASRARRGSIAAGLAVVALLLAVLIWDLTVGIDPPTAPSPSSETASTEDRDALMRDLVNRGLIPEQSLTP